MSSRTESGAQEEPTTNTFQAPYLELHEMLIDGLIDLYQLTEQCRQFNDTLYNQFLTGVINESLIMAGLWKWPVIHVCENNHYALSMTNERSSAFPESNKSSGGCGIPSECVDGNDVVAVRLSSTWGVDRARSAEGAPLLECLTYRFRGHVRFGPGKIGDEYHMAKGHLYERPDQPENNFCTTGSGYFMLETKEGARH